MKLWEVLCWNLLGLVYMVVAVAIYLWYGFLYIVELVVPLPFMHRRGAGTRL